MSMGQLNNSVNSVERYFLGEIERMKLLDHLVLTVGIPQAVWWYTPHIAITSYVVPIVYLILHDWWLLAHAILERPSPHGIVRCHCHPQGQDALCRSGTLRRIHLQQTPRLILRETYTLLHFRLSVLLHLHGYLTSAQTPDHWSSQWNSIVLTCARVDQLLFYSEWTLGQSMLRLLIQGTGANILLTSTLGASRTSYQLLDLQKVNQNTSICMY